MGSILAGLFGRYLGEEGASWTASILVALTFICSCFAFYSVGLNGNPCYFTLGTWIDCQLFQISWSFIFDSLTVVMLIVVTSVSTLVHFYSMEYMRHDPHRARFMSYLSIFTFFMLILVTADNFIQMFLGWEGVGLCSYLLINFWFTRIQANKAAIQAMIVNRIGDFALSLGIFAIFVEFQAVDYATVFASAPSSLGNTLTFFNYEVGVLNLICVLIFLGAVGKSAQLGLHVWLPCAMEGPTPVSALIHAATMVTAGVFLIARCSPLFEYAPEALLLVSVMGAATAFFAATTGLMQNDMKKVIAFSTCSQLGYMVFACGMSSYSVGVFHLANHAFFKALLFLSAGSVIHAVNDEQDMRRMGGLVRVLPFTYAMIFIGSVALMGFPFLTGFYSKDVILEVAYAKYTIAGHFSFWLGTLAAFFTALYSGRLLYLVFLSDTQTHRSVMENAHDSPPLMAIPLIILAFGSIFVGFLGKDLFIGLGSNFWGNALFVHPNHNVAIDAEFIPHSAKLIPVCFSITGATLAFVLYHKFSHLVYNLKTSPLGTGIYTFLNRKWFFDKIYTEYVIQPSMTIGYHTTYKLIDRGMIEILGPLGISRTLYNKAVKVSRLQSGLVFSYALMMLLAAIMLLIFIVPISYYPSFIDPRIVLVFAGIAFLNVLRHN
jgi:proton-translocating NADH-quinone oxidoreductase chain L